MKSAKRTKIDKNECHIQLRSDEAEQDKRNRLAHYQNYSGIIIMCLGTSCIFIYLVLMWQVINWASIEHIPFFLVY